MQAFENLIPLCCDFYVDLKKKKIEFIGHISRLDDFLSDVFEGKI